MDKYDNQFSFDIMERGHALRDAVLDGDLDQVTTAIETGTCCLNEADVHGRTVLHLAACRGQTEMIRLFVDNGADVKVVDRHGNTPLHWCGHVDVVELLVEMGADMFALNKIGFTPRKLAERRGVSKDTIDLFRHLEKEARKPSYSPKAKPQDQKKDDATRVTKQQKSLVLPSIWYEFYCDMGAKNMCLLILGLLGCSLYMAYILTGLHRGAEDKIPLDSQTYKIHL